MPKKSLAMLLVKIVLLGLVSVPPLFLLVEDSPRLFLSPHNAWLGPTLLVLLGSGFALSVVLLLRTIPLGYCLWAQAVVSFQVFTSYYGFLRREDSFRRYPDPETLGSGVPTASWSGILSVVLIGLAIAYLPVAVRVLVRRLKARKVTGCGDVHGAPLRSGAGKQPEAQ